MPEGGCDTVQSLCWSRLLPGPVDTWSERSPRWSRFAGRACDPMWDACWSNLFLKDCTPWNGPRAGAVCGELQLVGRTHLDEVHGELSPIRGTSRWSRGRV